MEKKEITEKARCNKCQSLMTYIRIKTSERVCRNCGHKERLEGKRGISS